MEQGGNTRWVIITSILAFILWSLMFYFKIGNFWWLMTGSAGTLAIIALILNRQILDQLFAWKSQWLMWGILSAVLLYFVFWVGDYLSALLFNFAPQEVGAIYGLKAGQNPLHVGLLLFFFIGPAEEIFWRGFLQNSLQKKFKNPIYGWIVAGLIYGFVHIWALNFMLLMAALICGLFWGYIFYRTGNLWPGIISHALWDVAVFLIIPIH